jgi:hypothetical protein
LQRKLLLKNFALDFAMKKWSLKRCCTLWRKRCLMLRYSSNIPVRVSCSDMRE